MYYFLKKAISNPEQKNVAKETTLKFNLLKETVSFKPIKPELETIFISFTKLNNYLESNLFLQNKPKSNFDNFLLKTNFFYPIYKTELNGISSIITFYVFFKLNQKKKYLLSQSRVSSLITTLKFYTTFKESALNFSTVLNQNTSTNLRLFQTLNDYFFAPSFYTNINKNSRWSSMEEIINHFLFYSEGPCLPAGFSQGGVEAPKGHLGVSIISNGTNKPLRGRIRSSILVMAGHLNNLVQNVGLGDFVVIVSASNIVVGEIDR